MPEQAPNDEPESEQALLQAAEQAFAAGNFRTLRPKLQVLHGVKSESVLTRVQALRRAISIDPVHIVLLLACLLALFVIAIREGTHDSSTEHGTTPPRGSIFGTSTQRAADQSERT
jgi:hypothetical protein